MCDDRAATSLATRRLQDGSDVAVTIDGEDLVALPPTGSSIIEHAVLDGADACRFPFLPHLGERSSTPARCPPTSFGGTVLATNNPFDAR